MFRILHLSDIHIGKTYKMPEDIACQIASDIDHVGLNNINCIIVTGDIFDGQVAVTDELINTGVQFFEILLSEINCNQEKKIISKEDIIFIPGNHDLIRVDNKIERWNKYRDFLKKFYGNIPSFYYENNFSLFKEYKNEKVAFVGFNSCEIEKRKLFDEKYISKFEKYIDANKFNSCETDKNKILEILRNESVDEYDDYGNIPLHQITPIERKVKKLDDYTIVALFHHHFYLFPEVAKQFGDSSLIRNYTQIIQHLQYMNVSVVLHGHKHFALERPFITDDYYESGDNIIHVFAGGSVGTDRKEEHTFGVLDLYEKKDDLKLKHNKFIYNGENLEPLVKKQVPPPKLCNRVVKLLEVLNTLNPEIYKIYEENAEKAFKTYDCCNKIISWISEAVTGFSEVYKYLDKDYHNILFLLYAINYRTICYMNIVGKEQSYCESVSKMWESFYDVNLEQIDFMILKKDYHNLFTYKKLHDAASYCDRLLNDCNNKKSQIYLAFTMLGIFFTDLYLVLTRYADDFKESIMSKINIKIEENKFHENVPAPRIVVKSDADRRSVYIELLCNDATAHKMAVLFVKEFDLLINKFEDYFKLIGLKVYYLLPKIDKDKMKNTLDNYNFEAYIPTLIPLLTGDNIYSEKVAFARELIQNAIDAISVRDAKDEKEFSKEILVELKRDENGRRYFKIVDRGTGMDRYKIERYFTSIGRSFYSGGEYEELNIPYKPISNFGIGFLSSFMVCKEIDVKTKYYIEESEGLKLHIPNYDGCFFVELDNSVNEGTEIKLYLDNSIEEKIIVNYIRKVMQDIKYPIKILYVEDGGKEEKILVPAHSIRKQKETEEFKFFVPFYDNGEVGQCDYIEDILSNKYIEKYEYGLLFSKINSSYAKGRSLVLNSGIVVERTTVRDILRMDFRRCDYGYYSYGENRYNEIIANFPANWLQLDVAREKVTSLSDFIKGQTAKRKNKYLEEKIADALYNQIVQYIHYSEGRKTNISIVYLQYMIDYALILCKKKELYEKILSVRYLLTINFSDKGLCYKVARSGESRERIRITYSDINARKEQNKWLNIFREEHSMEAFGYEQKYEGFKQEILHIFHQLSHIKAHHINQDIKHRIYHLMSDMTDNLRIESNNKFMLKELTLVVLEIADKENLREFKEWKVNDFDIISCLEFIFLHYFRIGEEKTQELNVSYMELMELFQN